MGSRRVRAFLELGNFGAGLTLSESKGFLQSLALIALTTFIALVCWSCSGLVGGNSQTSPQITTSNLPSGQVQVAYQTTLAATGGTPPYTWSIASGVLPTGLALSASSGTISGAPTQAGSFPLTFQVKDSPTTSQTATQALSLTIANAGPLSVTISPVSTTVQVLTTVTFSASISGTTNTAVTWSVNGATGGNSTVGT